MSTWFVKYKQIIHINLDTLWPATTLSLLYVTDWLNKENLIFTNFCHFSLTIKSIMLFPAFLVLAFASVSLSASEPVLVELYYESLCPYCREFINDQLYPTFVKLANTGTFLHKSTWNVLQWGSNYSTFPVFPSGPLVEWHLIRDFHLWLHKRYWLNY